MWTTVEDDFRVATPRANGNNEKDDDETGGARYPGMTFSPLRLNARATEHRISSPRLESHPVKRA